MGRRPSSARAELSLYAIVPSAESAALQGRPRGLRLVTVGPFTALAGKPAAGRDQASQALAHDRVVRRAVASCSSVVPFRMGSSVASEEALARVLERHRAPLEAMLGRFSGRVEMGLKMRLPPGTEPASSPAAAAPPGAQCSLHRIAALTHGPLDRREVLRRDAGKVTFEGSYLIDRADVAAFWRAVEEIRRAEPALPLLGTGPWAPYSFCAALRQEAA